MNSHNTTTENENTPLQTSPDVTVKFGESIFEVRRVCLRENVFYEMVF
jgi:hypothetical protein